MIDYNNQAAKRIISEFLGFLKDKVDNDRLTMADIDAVASMIKENLDISGTAEDFARYYGQNVDGVRHIIHRKVLEKPVRKVYYSFRSFASAIPKSWHKQGK